MALKESWHITSAESKIRSIVLVIASAGVIEEEYVMPL
jgi:hypothetical protein